MKKTFKTLTALLATATLAFGLTACNDKEPAKDGAKTVSSLEQIQKDGKVRIGVFSDKPPFGYVDAQGKSQGFDVEIGKAIGKDLLGDENKVEFVLVDAANRAEYLLSKKVDIILANFTVTPARKEVVDFMLGRFRAWYQDEGIAVDVIQSVLARRPTRPADFDARVRAVSHFRTLDSAEALAAANKRVSNILAKADAAIGEINLTACVEPAEKALAEAVLALRTEVQPLIAQGDYTAVLDKLANLRAPVDSFFDNVMVNAEDPALRQNRLAILNTLQDLFLQVADISVLQ